MPTNHDKTLLSRQVEAADVAINALVNKLYGLRSEEIKIIKGERELIELHFFNLQVHKKNPA
jgi:hypothetical protein